MLIHASGVLQTSERRPFSVPSAWTVSDRTLRLSERVHYWNQRGERVRVMMRQKWASSVSAIGSTKPSPCPSGPTRTNMREISPYLPCKFECEWGRVGAEGHRPILPHHDPHPLMSST
ncbi:hypothetical protein Y032_0019g3949 [Ancylostoma ceylanicum]|uniref:Uncharacterized protein n=1 Tax=Ancylostoma ceylanicum TaxID=53326 RepID=A0A016V4L0_9BILA|nr:hypothetical protein Y032_0019g3949 [Ancylostoma ceylanicum]